MKYQLLESMPKDQVTKPTNSSIDPRVITDHHIIKVNFTIINRHLSVLMTQASIIIIHISIPEHSSPEYNQ